MLYLIVPPIVIIVASIVLLFLFSRKGGELVEKKESIEAGGSQVKGVIQEKRKIVYSRLKHYALIFLEKATGEFKNFLLIFHNATGRLMNVIKEKKSRYAMKIKKEVPAKEETSSEKDFFVSNAKPSTEKMAMKNENIENKEKEKEEEKIPEPILKEELVQPEKKSDPKDEYEKILIERIAENPRDLEAYERLGNYYMEQQNYMDAKECYKQVLKLSPINRQAKIKLNKIIRILGR